jgi:hypothetical protein
MREPPPSDDVELLIEPRAANDTWPVNAGRWQFDPVTVLGPERNLTSPVRVLLGYGLNLRPRDATQT